jgi:outer membrane protein W
MARAVAVMVALGVVMTGRPAAAGNGSAATKAKATRTKHEHDHEHAKRAAAAAPRHDDDVDITIDDPATTTTDAEAADGNADGDATDADDAHPIVVRRAPPARRVRNELYFRAGLAFVSARLSTSALQLQPTAIASLAANPMALQGGIASSSGDVVTAIIGFAPAALGGHIGFETVIGAASATKLSATGPLATQSIAPTALGLPTGIPALGSQLGQASATPLMLTAVYRLPALGPITPYVGAGPSILLVTGTKITNQILDAVATPQFSVSPVLGAIAQAGLDVHVYGSIYARLDVREIWFETAQATISNIQVHTTIPDLETVDVGSVKSAVTANPIIVQAGVGATF